MNRLPDFELARKSWLPRTVAGDRVREQGAAWPLRLERMLLIAAIAHFLAMLVGGHARRQNLDRSFRANTVPTKATHSDFALGIYYAVRLRWRFKLLLSDFFSERVCLFEKCVV